MKIFVHHIPVTNKKIQLKGNEEWLHNMIREDHHGELLSCEGELILHRREDLVQVKGNLTLVFERSCDVCGEAISLTLDQEVSLLYDAFPETQEEEEQTQQKRKEEETVLQEDELDIGWYDNGKLDLSAVLSEHITLNIEPIVQCSDANVKRLVAGTCQTIPVPADKKENKNTYNPFANLGDL